jgi:hypothetical protein
MKILKAVVILGGDTHEIHKADVIEHAGQFWIVPEWLDNIALGVTMPRRIISLATCLIKGTRVATRNLL